jgi:predicted RNA-binding protein with PUA-like domain
MSRLSVDQKRWQAEDDANTLALAEEIKTSKLRMSAATKQAKAMVTEQTKRLNSIKKISKKKKK